MQAPGDTVLVAGATGGVGQILTAKLLEVAITKVPNVAFHWVVVQQSANPRFASEHILGKHHVAMHDPHTDGVMHSLAGGQPQLALLSWCSGLQQQIDVHVLSCRPDL